MISRRRSIQVALVIGALTTSAVFLAQRGRKPSPAMAVYARFPANRPVHRGLLPLLVESFDLTTHRSMPVEVREVLARGGPSWESKAGFEQEGDDPAIIRVRIPDAVPDSLILRAENDLGPMEVEIPIGPRPETQAIGESSTGLGWPIRTSCDGFRILLLSETGVPEVEVQSRILVLVEPTTPDVAATIALRSSREESAVALEPWGGAILTWTPRSLRTFVRVALNWVDGQCEAALLMTAASRRTRVRDLSVEPLADRHYLMKASLTTQASRLYMLVATRSDPLGPGPLLDARIVPVRDGRLEALLDLPGPGVYQVRFTGEPLQSGPGARGVDTIMVVGNRMAADPLLQGWFEHIGTGWDKEAVRPFVLATLAALAPVTLSQVANTAAEVRATLEKERTRRDAILLGVLALCLVGLVVVMAVEVVQGQRGSRRIDEVIGDADAGRIHAWGRLLPALLVGVVLLAAIAALILVLKTL